MIYDQVYNCMLIRMQLVSTLLDAGYDLRANCEESTVMFIHLIQDAFRQENGLIGFGT